MTQPIHKKYNVAITKQFGRYIDGIVVDSGKKIFKNNSVSSETLHDKKNSPHKNPIHKIVKNQFFPTNFVIDWQFLLWNFAQTRVAEAA